MSPTEKEINRARNIGDQPCMCPRCRTPANWWQVMGIKREEFTGREVHIEGPCPHCKLMMTEEVPHEGPPYVWVAKNPSDLDVDLETDPPPTP